MDMDINLLQQLCAHYGIATDYHDLWGQHHPVQPQALLNLLAAFDPQLATDPSLPKALQRARSGSWEQPITPTVAIRNDYTHWGVRLRLPRHTQQLHWQLRGEDGEVVAQAGQDAHALGEISQTERQGVTWVERHLAIDRRLASGYYRLRVDTCSSECLVICAPQQCYRPRALQHGGRVWGPSIQLYALRSPQNWGMGDFGDLLVLIRQMAARGADIIGLNPLHALFMHNPAHASPYSPCSRQQLNVLYIDVPAVQEFADCAAARALVASAAFQQRLADLREPALVDYPGVARAKFEVLEILHTHFAARHLGEAPDAQGRAFLAFVARGGQALRRHALFEAIQAHLHAADPSLWGWPAWPPQWQDPAGERTEDFARTHAQRLQFHQYLQWQASIQLARAHETCTSLGMGVGLYLDLAVSVDRGGSDTWEHQNSFAVDASVGAPPDDFNLNGQGWGLPPLRPDRLRLHHYRIFIDTLRSNMRGAGALRIDHVMGLMRLFWIPPGGVPRDGAYVYYPLDEMMAIVALESQRSQCLVIGEDLGTVADNMREALARSDVLSYRLLYFERQRDGNFTPPAHYPPAALVAIGTHDLATLSGWWGAHDLQLRLQLGLQSDLQLLERQLLERLHDRTRLVMALHHAGLLAQDALTEAATGASPSTRTRIAIHAWVAAAPSAVMMVQLEDVLGLVDQVNLPSTVDEYPNWRRKLPLDLRQLAHDAAMADLVRTLATLRPRAAANG
ncbi:MAG: 4-alpha-glucanotransferase [Rhodoferax sp.]|nr:4-alpha-glucanotransferase [Rhodoferax sp.]MBP9930491.1 4-alpha-glucanotransferase [Rhodoferax sp.]HQZ06586.1 4-alpha-glucanotransferase [Burkholderiaceae bacterium]